MVNFILTYFQENVYKIVYIPNQKHIEALHESKDTTENRRLARKTYMLHNQMFNPVPQLPNEVADIVNSHSLFRWN